MASGMCIEAKVAELTRAVAEAAAVADKKSTMPVLGCVRLAAVDGKVQVVGSSLDLTVARSVPVAVERKGQACIPARALHDILRALSGEKVRLEVADNHRLMVRSGGAEFRLVGLSPDDFPALPELEAEVKYRTAPAAVVLRLLGRAANAVSTDDSRPTLTCVLVEKEGQQVVAVATDGHRMVVAREAGDFVPKKWLLPGQSVGAMRRLLAGVEGDVSLAETDRAVLLKVGDALLAARQGEGQFPDWRSVVPKERGAVLKVKAGSLRDTMKRVGLVATKHAVTLTVGTDGMVVEAVDPDRGEAKERVEGAQYEGAEVRVGVNGRFVLDALEAAEVEEVGVSFGKEQPGLEPLELRPTTGGDQAFLAVIMPMRI